MTRAIFRDSPKNTLCIFFSKPSRHRGPSGSIGPAPPNAALRCQTTPLACSCAHSASENSRDRVWNDTPSGPSSEKVPPPPRLEYIDDELGVLPVFVLRWTHIERTASDLSQQHIVGGVDFTLQVAVCRAAVTAAARLMKDQIRAMLSLQPFDQGQRCFGRGNSFNHAHSAPYGRKMRPRPPHKLLTRGGRTLHGGPAPSASPRCGRTTSVPCSEEAELVRAVAHQQVLGLLIVVEHHLVVLATDAGLLVATEGSVRGIRVIAVGPTGRP